MRSRLLAGVAALAITVGAGAVAAVPANASSATHGDRHGREAKPSTTEFDASMRKLWEDHITWTRLFIVSATADLPDLQATTDRLLQNQADLGDAIKPYYGDDAGAQLTELLRVHILTAADLLNAAKAGDDVKLTEAQDTWYTNADDIAAFLAEANPKYWGLEDMKSMMREHLDLTLEEAVAHLQGRYTDDVAAYDKVHDAILEMSDMLAAGIEQQFPNRFH
jgi:hypothetical protein